MPRLRACGILVGFLAALTALAAQEPTFRDVGDAVRIFATVTDRDGRLVTTLTKDDFEVRDEGTRQSLTIFDNSPQPIRLIVLLDVSGSMHGNLPLLRDATEQLFAKLDRNDRVSLGTFGHDITITPSLEPGSDQLRRAMPVTIAEDAPTPLWRAIDEGLRTFVDDDDRRPVVLVLSDGKDSGPIGFRQRFVSQVEVIDSAREKQAMVYAIGMRSRNSPAVRSGGIAGPNLRTMMTADLPDPGLARVAEESGGGYAEIRFGQDLGAAFAQVVDELHSQYLLGFALPKRDGKVHDVDVRIKQAGMKVRARKDYVAPKASQ